MTPKRTRREWLAGLKEGDDVVYRGADGNRRDAVILRRGSMWFEVHVPVAWNETGGSVLRWFQAELFRLSDGRLQGRCLQSPRPRIEPVEGGGK